MKNNSVIECIAITAIYKYALTGLPLCVDTENTTPRHVDHVVFESLHTEKHILMNDSDNTELKHLHRTDIETRQKNVIAETHDQYASGAKSIYSLSKLAVILFV